MGLLQRIHVTPFNGQVELSDPKATDYPQWQTGNEPAVALAQAVAVATQSDSHGDVAVVVLVDTVNDGLGELLAVVMDGGVFCNRYVTGDEHTGVVVPL